MCCAVFAKTGDAHVHSCMSSTCSPKHCWIKIPAERCCINSTHKCPLAGHVLPWTFPPTLTKHSTAQHSKTWAEQKSLSRGSDNHFESYASTVLHDVLKTFVAIPHRPVTFIIEKACLKTLKPSAATMHMPTLAAPSQVYQKYRSKVLRLYNKHAEVVSAGRENLVHQASSLLDFQQDRRDWQQEFADSRLVLLGQTGLGKTTTLETLLTLTTEVSSEFCAFDLS